MSKQSVINKIREISDKLNRLEILSLCDAIFAKNALQEYAEKLERRSESATKAREANAIPSAAGHREYINQKRWEKHYRRLSGDAK